MIGYFVTGTDTGVGKTHVACALARRARVLGRSVCAFKPIESGCTSELGDDQRLLVAAAGAWQHDELRGAYQLRRPVAPLVASRREGVAIDIAHVADLVRVGARRADVVIIEGVGGWRVPLTVTADVAALAKQIALPVVVVARAGLGTINHSLLTLEAIARDACSIAALVLSCRLEDDRELARENRDEIARRWPTQIVLYDGAAEQLDPLLTFST